MTDVNLIPADYTRQQNIKRVVKRFLYCFVALLLLGFAARTALGVVYNHEKSRAEKLKSGEVLMEEQKKQLDQLAAKKEDLQLRLNMLEHLRGGPPAKEMFILIDKAINKSVWLTKLNFFRAGEERENSRKSRSTGYFIIVPKEEQEASQEIPWLNSGHLNVTGMALTHSALAEFVNLLVAQPHIKKVQVQNTHSRKYLEASVVEFELTVVMISDNSK
jgi:Tfp pilus assembly protein PilN